MVEFSIPDDDRSRFSFALNILVQSIHLFKNLESNYRKTITIL